MSLIPAGGGDPVFDTVVDTPPIDESGDFSHSLTTTGIADGTYLLTFTVTNNRGGFACEERSIRIDKSGPSVSITDPTDGTNVAGTDVAVSGSAVSTASEITSIQITIDDGAGGADGIIVNETYTAPDFSGVGFNYIGSYFSYSWDTTAAGFDVGESPNITLIITDLAGNISNDNIIVNLDPNAPTISFDTYDHPDNPDYSGKPLTSGRYVHGSGTIHGTASDSSSVSSVAVSVDGGTFIDTGVLPGSSVTWSYSLSGLSEGTHSVVARVTDNSLDINTTSITIEIDNTAPSLNGLSTAVNDGSGTDYLHGQAVVSGTASDSNASVETVSLSVEEPLGDGPEDLVWDNNESFSVIWDTESLPTYTGNPVVTGAVDAGNGIILSVSVTDAAGNVYTENQTVNVRPYISALGQSSAYLGQTGLIIYGDNFTYAGGADPDVSIGGGSISSGSGGVSSADSGTITFDLDSVYPSLNGLSSGPVLVTYNGAQIVSAFSAKQANRRYVYYTNGTTDIEIADGNGAGNGQYMYSRIDHDTANSRTWITYVRGTGVRVATSTSEFSGYPLNSAITATPATATYNDIAVDDTGNGHHVYYDSGALYHSISTDGGSSFAAVRQIDGATSDTGAWLTIAVEHVDGGSDSLHAAYHDATENSLKYAYFDGTTWDTPVTVDAVSAG